MDDLIKFGKYKLKERVDLIKAAANASDKQENLEFPNNKLEPVDVIEVPIDLLLYNPDNTRYLEKITDKVSTFEEKECFPR